MLAALKELAADVGSEGVAEIVDLFLGDSVELLRDLRTSSELGDATGIARAAHSLKSTAATVGAEELAGHCLEMERLGRAGLVREAIPNLDNVETEYRHVRALLGALRSQVETADL
jgi:HPt (histidine-containing phosphotransfer) domain-containing protein